MPPQDRFDKLESAKAELPADVKDALSRISRFQNLEIGAPAPRPPVPVVPAVAEGAAAPARPLYPGETKVPCVHCGQMNEKERDTCWACYRYVRVKAPQAAAPRAPDDITLVLDGVTYTSGQADLPEDIAELMRRIRKRGYSQELVAEWRSWRATRNARPEPAPEGTPADMTLAGSDEALGIKVFRGQRVSVIRLDGKVYTSDDPNLTPELKQLFAYIEQNGVTPALMDYLRQLGTVKVRPQTTAYPSDGDVDFWKTVAATPRPQRGSIGDDLARREAEYEVEQARWRYEDARRRAVGSAVGIAFFILYILASIFLR